MKNGLRIWCLAIAMAIPVTVARGGGSIGGGVGPITPLPTVKLQVSPQTVHIGGTITLKAHVFRFSGTPVPGVPVKFYWQQGSNRYLGTAVTSSSGYAVLHYVPTKRGTAYVQAVALPWMRQDRATATVLR